MHARKGPVVTKLETIVAHRRSVIVIGTTLKRINIAKYPRDSLRRLRLN